MSALAVLNQPVQALPQGSADYSSTLLRAKEALDAAVEISVDVSQIRRFEGQPRKYFNPAGIRSLANSIGKGGQTTSGLIREKPAETRYELIDGERRWRAVRTIPEEVRPLYKAKLIVADDDVVQYLISGVANFNREGHTALETMETICHLIAVGFPMEEIATVLGISVQWAYQIHGLSNLTGAVQKLLDPELPRKQQLPVTAAIQIAKIEARLQMALAERVINREVSLARLRNEVVRTAKNAGSPIRLYEVKPKKRLASALNKANVLARTAEDLRNLLDNPEMKRYLRTRSEGARHLRESLDQAGSTILQCKTKLER